MPELDGSGAAVAVLGAYIVLPGSRMLTWIFPVFLVRIPGWVFPGVWFLYQLFEADFSRAAGVMALHGLAPRHPRCKGSRMPATKMRIGLVSCIVSIDMNNQY